MKKSLLIILLLPILVFSQNNQVPDSFKHLKKIRFQQRNFIDIFTSDEVDTNVSLISIDQGSFKYEPLHPICLVKINPNEPKYLIGFCEGASDDPTFEIFKVVNNKYIHLDGVSGETIYIPGNGNIYVSGRMNEMFERKRKFQLKNDQLVEVKQPYYHVGMKTITKKPIKLYSNISCTESVASLPSNSQIEVLVSNIKDETEFKFLIKTSFGLIGWWELDSFYSEEVEGLWFLGD